jgi:hypothetical protein
MLLLFLTIVTTLSTTITVAIFGVHNVEQLLSNPPASWLWAAILNRSSHDDYMEDELTSFAFLDSFPFKSATLKRSRAQDGTLLVTYHVGYQSLERLGIHYIQLCAQAVFA